VFVHLQRLSYEYHNAAKSGHTLAIMTSDISTLSKLLQDGLINFVVQALMLVIITGVLFYMDVSLALILLCTSCPPSWVRLSGSGASPERSFASADRNADVVADLRQSLYGIKQIHLFNRAEVNIREHDSVVGKYQAASGESARMTSLYSAVTDFIEISDTGQCSARENLIEPPLAMVLGLLVSSARIYLRVLAPMTWPVQSR